MLLDKTIHIPDLGDIGADSGFLVLERTEDGKFSVGKNGVVDILATGVEIDGRMTALKGK